MIDITVNGAAESIPAETTIAQLLERLSLVGKRLAVERNGEIVPKGRHAESRIAAGDRIEIVVAVGGG
jgi:sulfur carrier protein